MDGRRDGGRPHQPTGLLSAPEQPRAYRSIVPTSTAKAATAWPCAPNNAPRRPSHLPQRGLGRKWLHQQVQDHGPRFDLLGLGALVLKPWCRRARACSMPCKPGSAFRLVLQRGRTPTSAASSRPRGTRGRLRVRGSRRLPGRLSSARVRNGWRRCRLGSTWWLSTLDGCERWPPTSLGLKQKRPETLFTNGRQSLCHPKQDQ